MDIVTIADKVNKKTCLMCAVVLGAVALLSGSGSLIEHGKIKNQLVNCTAKTSGVIEAKGNTGKIEFTVDGKKYTAKHKLGAGEYDGMSTEVKYNPSKPKQNYVGQYPDRKKYKSFLSTAILFGVFAILVGIGIPVSAEIIKKKYGDEDE